MPLVAVTRLHIRSFRFMLPLAWWSWRSLRQAKGSAGNLGAKVRSTPGRAFWTMTVWQDESTMNAYRITPPHRDAMPRLLNWCDEASLVHWNQDSSELSSWETAAQRMAESGRLSKVYHPSAAQRAGRLDYTHE